MNDFIFNLLEHLKYWGIFLGAFIEGPATAIAAGFLAKSSFLNFIPALVIHFVGDFFADMFYFSIGRLGNRRFLNWLESKFHFSQKEGYEKMRKNFDKHHIKIIFGAKLTHFLGLPAIIGIGLSNYSWKKFALFNLTATIIKSTLLLSFGYSVGIIWQQKISIIARIFLITFILAIILVTFFLTKKRHGEKI